LGSEHDFAGAVKERQGRADRQLFDSRAVPAGTGSDYTGTSRT